MTQSTDSPPADGPAFRITKRYWRRRNHPDFVGTLDGRLSIMVLHPGGYGSSPWPVEVVDTAVLDYTHVGRGEPQPWWYLIGALRTNDPCRISREIACHLLDVLPVIWRGRDRYLLAQRETLPVLLTLGDDTAVAQQLRWKEMEEKIGAPLASRYTLFGTCHDMLRLPCPPPAQAPIADTAEATFAVAAEQVKPQDVVFLRGQSPGRVLTVERTEETVTVDVLAQQTIVAVTLPRRLPVRVRRTMEVPGMGPGAGQPAALFRPGQWILLGYGAHREVVSRHVENTAVTLRLRSPRGEVTEKVFHRDNLVAFGSPPEGTSPSTQDEA